MGRQTSAGWENKILSSKMRQCHSPDGAGGCCITSNKSLTCLQLVFTSNWSNFPHAFATRGFVGVSWPFLFNIAYQIGCTLLFVYIPGFLLTSWFSPWWFVSDNKRFTYLLFRKPLGYFTVLFGQRDDDNPIATRSSAIADNRAVFLQLSAKNFVTASILRNLE